MRNRADEYRARLERDAPAQRRWREYWGRGEEAEDFDAFTVGAVALHAAVSAPEWAAAWALVGIGENTIGAWLDRLRAVDGGKPGSLIDIAPIGAGEAQWSEAMREYMFQGAANVAHFVITATLLDPAWGRWWARNLRDRVGNGSVVDALPIAQGE